MGSALGGEGGRRRETLTAARRDLSTPRGRGGNREAWTAALLDRQLFVPASRSIVCRARSVDKISLNATTGRGCPTAVRPGRQAGPYVLRCTQGPSWQRRSAVRDQAGRRACPAPGEGCEQTSITTRSGRICPRLAAAPRAIRGRQGRRAGPNGPVFCPRSLAISRQPGAGACGQDRPDPAAGRGRPPAVVRRRKGQAGPQTCDHARMVRRGNPGLRPLTRPGGPWAATRPRGPWAATTPGGPWADDQAGRAVGRDQARAGRGPRPGRAGRGPRPGRAGRGPRPGRAADLRRVGGEPGEAASPRPSRTGSGRVCPRLAAAPRAIREAGTPPPPERARFRPRPRDQSSAGREVWTGSG